MSLHERAIAAGSDAAGIATANDREFLLKCLKVASLDVDLQSDVADACELHDFTALTLASGDLSASSIETKLYLTADEAKMLIKVCERECAKIGVTFGRAIESDDTVIPVLVESPADNMEEAAASASGVGAVPPVSTGREEQSVANLKLDVDSPTTPDLPEKNREASPRTQTQEKRSSKKLLSPKPSTSPDMPKEKTSATSAQRASTSRVRPASAPISQSTLSEPRRPLSRSSSSGQPNQPGSARKPPMRRSSSQLDNADNESQTSSDGRVPSYLRSTAAHKARAKKEGEAESRPGSAQTTPRKHTVPQAGFISSTLLRPTAAFLNRFVPPKDDSGKWSPGEGAPRLTQSVSVPVSASKTPRNTRVQPFHLSTDVRGSKDKTRSTDELQMQKAKEEMDKLKQVKSPKSRSADAAEGAENIKSFRPNSARKPTQFKPFNLASLERHNKAQEELQKRIAEERAREEAEHSKFARKASARQLSATAPARMNSKKQVDNEAS